MDLNTINTYNKYSTFFLNKYLNDTSGISKYFSRAFKDKSKILEIGCGIGKDLNLLLERGYDAYGIDPSKELLNHGIQRFPNIKDKVRIDSLPGLETVSDKFDGILISAVLMHIPQFELFDSILSIKKHLNHEGSLLLSIPKEYPDINEKYSRDPAGRLFNGITANQLILLFERIGFRLIEKWEDEVNIESSLITWESLFFKLQYENQSRPLDSIDGILNKDQKVATYKIALFRALAEIATQNQKAAYWLPNGIVKLHIDLIIDKWIEYYWAIFNSKDFIPQIQKESIDCTKPVAFRKPMTKLINHYQTVGGLEGYKVDVSKLNLSPLSLEDNAKTRKAIRTTLINGPIKHAGGVNSPNKIFGFDNKGYITMPDLVWKELTLLGPWIADSTILRWAELTSKLSKGVYKASHIIDLLLFPESNRRIADARMIYMKQSYLKCVWTSQELKEFELDHIIPFSLWKNNDLWNLVPSKPAINRKKSDKLVTYDYLMFSRDNIIYSWQRLYEAEPNRFLNEAKILTGNSINNNNWENLLFMGLKEAIEYTAIQRGIERWEP